jgi:hypothetical protein
MACGARQGLKPLRAAARELSVLCLNGLWSPSGIETINKWPKLNKTDWSKWPVQPASY